MKQAVELECNLYKAATTTNAVHLDAGGSNVSMNINFSKREQRLTFP